MAGVSGEGLWEVLGRSLDGKLSGLPRIVLGVTSTWYRLLTSVEVPVLTVRLFTAAFLFFLFFCFLSSVSIIYVFSDVSSSSFLFYFISCIYCICISPSVCIFYVFPPPFLPLFWFYFTSGVYCISLILFHSSCICISPSVSTVSVFHLLYLFYYVFSRLSSSSLFYFTFCIYYLCIFLLFFFIFYFIPPGCVRDAFVARGSISTDIPAREDEKAGWLAGRLVGAARVCPAPLIGVET